MAGSKSCLKQLEAAMIEYLDGIACVHCGSTIKDLSCNERTGWHWMCDDCVSNKEIMNYNLFDEVEFINAYRVPLIGKIIDKFYDSCGGTSNKPVYLISNGLGSICLLKASEFSRHIKRELQLQIPCINDEFWGDLIPENPQHPFIHYRCILDDKFKEDDL